MKATLKSIIRIANQKYLEGSMPRI